MLASVCFYRLPSYALLLTLLCASSLWAQWEPDRRLTFNDSASCASFNNAKWIAAGLSGDVHVAWFDYRDGIYPRVYYKRSTDFGISWLPDTPLVDSLRSGYPSVAVLGTYVYLVWGDNRDGNPELYYKHSTDSGVSWSPDTRLTYSAAYDEWLPSLSVSGAGVHAAFREDYSPTPFFGYMHSTDFGMTWSAETLIAHSSMLSAFPSSSVSNSIVHLVWHNFNGSMVNIYYKRSTDNGLTWSSDTSLTNIPPSAQNPSIAASGTVVHVVWADDRDGSGGNWEIYYKRSTDSGVSWSPDIRLTYDSHGSNFPSVCASSDNVHVVWLDNNNRKIGIGYLRSTDSGLTWGPDTIFANPPDSCDRPCVAAAGPAVQVAWMDYRDGNWEIYYKRNPTGNSGVEVSSPVSLFPCLLVPLSVIPNPFVSYAKAPGYEGECFALYDVSGRNVGVFKGDRIGYSLSPGVYFLRPEGRDAKPLRVVKVR